MKLFLSLLIVLFTYLFISPLSAKASVLFTDKFDGSGELSEYNNSYKILSDFHPNTGTFNVIANHLETGGMDPGYVYTQITGDKLCASIDFNWTGGNSSGNWTNIILQSTHDNFGGAFQIRNDSPTQQRWVYYNGNGNDKSGNISIDTTKTHTIKACILQHKIIGYLNGEKLFEGEDSTNPTNGYFGFASQSPTYFLDNFTIQTFDIPLDVPLIKQTDTQWKATVYDSANVWSPADAGIGTWGCALTSAAMIFQYYNINKMPNNQPLTPETLNNWLKNEIDGYLNEGWVNWIALSRLSKKAKSNNPLFTNSALEYKRFSGNNKNQLSSDLSNNIPGILEVPGHFVVATGIQNTTFFINDPYYNRTLLTDYGNSFINLGRYLPSNTDLSYMLFYIDKDTTITVQDALGNNLGELFIQNPYKSPNNIGKTNGSPYHMFLLEKPDSGNFIITLKSTSNHLYTFNSMLYDKNGEVSKYLHSGIIGSGSEMFSLHFNKINTQQNIIKPIITYDSLLGDIKELQAQKLITPTIAASLTQVINNAKQPLNINPKLYQVPLLNSFKQIINSFKGTGVDPKAHAILLLDINSLISSL